MLLYCVTARDVAALDRYEGAPVYYHRITVFVKDGDGKLRRAFSYKMGNGFTDTAPSLAYVLTIVCGCRDWHIESEPEVDAALDARLAEPVEEE